MRVVTTPAPAAVRLAAWGARPAGQPEKPAAELLSNIGLSIQICRVDDPPCLRKVC